MSQVAWKNTLRNVKALKCLDESVLKEMLDQGEILKFGDSTIILREGDIDTDVYILGKGSVAITLGGIGGKELPFDSIGVGGLFGEMAQIEKKPRIASVIARGNCELLKISGEYFEQLLENNAQLKSNIMLILSERMRKTIEQVLSVKLRSFDDKFELTNTKLDANLKAVETQLQAAHTVFEQTAARANDVIESTERSRKWIYGLVGLLPVALGALGLFGMNKFNQVAELDGRVKEVTSEIELKLQKVSALDGKITKAVAVTAAMKQDQDQLAGVETLLYREVTRHHFRDEVFHRPKVALDLFGRCLEINDLVLTEELFKIIERGIAIEEDRGKFVQLLSDGLSRRLTRSEKQTGLSHYYLLAAALLDQNQPDFEKRLSKFDQYIGSFNGALSFSNDFSPDVFKYLLKKQENLDAIDDIENIWRRLSRG